MDRLRAFFSQLFKTDQPRQQHSIEFPRKSSSSRRKPIKIAFTGLPGVGKSSLINGLRNIFDENDRNYAPVSEVESSTKTLTYKCPFNPQLRFTEYHCTPTSEFEKSLAKVDYIVIVIGRRVTETDLKLAQFAERLNISFCIVRTKFDQDIENSQRRSSKSPYQNVTINPKTVLADDKKSLKINLTDYILQELRTARINFSNRREIYFVSNAGFEVFLDSNRAAVNEEWSKFQTDEDALWQKFQKF